eukprot:Polyplicarium_translucidae@DN4718_c0_g1_i1.p1
MDALRQRDTGFKVSMESAARMCPILDFVGVLLILIWLLWFAFYFARHVAPDPFPSIKQYAVEISNLPVKLGSEHTTYAEQLGRYLTSLITSAEFPGGQNAPIAKRGTVVHQAAGAKNGTPNTKTLWGRATGRRRLQSAHCRFQNFSNSR